MRLGRDDASDGVKSVLSGLSRPLAAVMPVTLRCPSSKCRPPQETWYYGRRLRSLSGMRRIVSLLLSIGLGTVGSEPTALLLENLALRRQLAVLTGNKARPRLRSLDRLFWVLLSRHWPAWRGALVIVKPATVIAWHRSRTHVALDKDTPDRRPVQRPGDGSVVAFPQVGELHHRYERLAA